jgi:hypothetical protein
VAKATSASPKPKLVKKVRFAVPHKTVAFALSPSEASLPRSAPIDRGGLRFAPGAPITMADLVTKLAKVEGKKTDR